MTEILKPDKTLGPDETLRPDICVIGAGSGGLTVAAAAASFGVSVVLVEKGRMGGDCLNYGCVPSKALIAAARHAHAMRHGSCFGIADQEPTVDFKAVREHIRNVIATIAPNDSVERFTALGVTVIKAEARFKDKRTVVAGNVEIRPRRFVVATGSSPLVPAVPGLDTIQYHTNETIFDMVRRPGHLVIIGGGSIGMELAQAYRRLGSKVTVIEAASVLAREDPEQAAIVVGALRKEGVDIREQAKVTRVERHGKSGVRVHMSMTGEEQRVDGTHLLVATGRAANVEGLGLEAAGVAYDGKGIRVGARLRSTNPRVYAVGDVAGGPQFTHAAGYQAGIVVRALLFRLPARQKSQLIPRATFTEPEIAAVGLTEVEATAKGGAVRILRWPYAENDRAHAENLASGFIKLVCSRRGRILGVSIVGAQAGEMINLWSLAVSCKMNVRAIAGYIAPYPTLGEIGKRAAISYFAGATRGRPVRRLIGLLRLFG